MKLSRRRLQRPSIRSSNAVLVCLGSFLLLVACGGGGGPTAPSLGAPASIAGQVVDASAAAGASAPVTGVTVRIEGTAVSAVTDGQGRFSLSGVPMGDQTVSFEQASQVAGLEIDNIQSAEAIQMVVSLIGSTVQVQSMARGNDSPAGETTVTIEKATNGIDADKPPGPSIPVDDPVSWTYLVDNTGGTELSGIEVTDDQGVLVDCPQTTLAAGANMTCTGSGIAVAGQYSNLGTVAALDPAGNPVGAQDASHYLGITEVEPSIDIEKSTNGEDADKAPGPTILVGEPVAWDYFVLNDGGVELSDIVVTDDQGVFVECPQSSLLADESMTCTGTGVAVEGQYANLGTVVADDGKGNVVDAADMSHYFGEVDGGGGGQFAIDVQSDKWNTNWTGSSGTFSVKIQDGDLAAVETDTIVLFEADPLIALVPTSLPRITGNHIRAHFAKADAFAILNNPQTGETRTVTLQFVAGGVTVALQADIEIVGPAI